MHCSLIVVNRRAASGSRSHEEVDGGISSLPNTPVAYAVAKRVMMPALKHHSAHYVRSTDETRETRNPMPETPKRTGNLTSRVGRARAGNFRLALFVTFSRFHTSKIILVP